MWQWILLMCGRIPEVFQLDEDLEPKKVAGVPPDAFSETGQRWGNPLYDWDKIKKETFSWWRKRMEHQQIFMMLSVLTFIGRTIRYT